MTTRINWVCGAIALSLITGGLGCSKAPPPSQPTAASSAQPAAVKRLAAQCRQPDGRFATIGTFAIQPGGRADLNVTGTGPDAERLRTAWAEVQTRPALKTKLTDADGNLVGETIPRGSPRYAEALADVMSREFGFFLTPVRDAH